MAIKKEILHYDENNSPVCRFVIPNQTGDYVELTNQGCKISGIHVHKLDGIMENIAAAAGTLWGGDFVKTLSDKIWTIADEGENSIFLSCECLSEENAYKVDLKLGAKVTWVNLNRLIIDYFITPKDKVSVDFSTNLTVNNEERDFFLRSFCPVVNRASGEVYSVQDTEYKDMTFVPVSCYDRFISPSEDIKPMIELSDKNSKLRISAYSTLSAAQMSSNADGALTIVCSEEKEVELNAGETLASRVIFGFDYIEDVVPDDNEPNPFSCFL